MGSALQQGEVLATPGGIGFASIAKALLILNDEARMSNDERIPSPRDRAPAPDRLFEYDYEHEHE